MSVPTVAASVASAVSAATPELKRKVLNRLRSATGSAVADVADLVAYIGKDPKRAKVVLTNAAGAGLDPTKVLVGVNLSNPVLVAAMSQAKQMYLSVQQEVVDHFVTTDTSSAVSAATLTALNRRRVEVALRVFGSEENYYLCQGLAPEHFAAHKIARGGAA